LRLARFYHPQCVLQRRSRPKVLLTKKNGRKIRAYRYRNRGVQMKEFSAAR
jgi:hypothetical protein